MGCYCWPRGIRRRLALGHQARGHVIRPCQNPSPPSSINSMQPAIKLCTRALKVCMLRLSCVLHITTIAQMGLSFVCSVHSLHTRGGECSPAYSWANLTHSLVHLFCSHSLHASCVLAYFIPQPVTMPRERGKPRRGSPWSPRRPSPSPPASRTSTRTLAPWSANPPPLPNPAPAEPLPGILLPVIPPRHSAEDLPSLRRPGNYTQQAPVSNTGVQLRDNLDNIYDLVFELRKEIDDLHFRVNSTNAKVTTLLHLLASMSASFPSHPGEESSAEVPHAATQPGNTTEQSAVSTGMACIASTSQQLQTEAPVDERATDRAITAMLWDSGLSFLEEPGV
jgi:hypothetical protein